VVVSQTRIRVSVIVPTFNRAAYIPEALASIYAQTVQPDEVIVVDDGSTDDTAAVIEQLGYPIRYHYQPNSGVAVARSTGVRLAIGDVIAWLDSDDTWLPTFLEETTAALHASPELDGVYTGVIFVDEEGTELSSAVRVVPSDRFFATLVEDCYVATPAMVIKRRCYLAVGDFDERFRISEDYDMWLRIARCCKIGGIPSPLVRYRQHGANTVSNLNAVAAARMALTEKHFGPIPTPTDRASTEERRAWAYALRFSALRHLEAGLGTEGWGELARAAELYPAILDRLDTAYELVCQHQPLGLRGNASLHDLTTSEAEVAENLHVLFAEASEAVQHHRSRALGNVYVALGMLADQAGDWPTARRYLLTALRTDATARQDRLVWRRLAKLTAGRPAADLLRRFGHSRDTSFATSKET